mmetsp:Transcript_3704/g.7079  ORF Transcript_3704/g.7079 Transcript_3704/m.7079 type:complete len:439 (-) Transcript_3704:1523-2839(-)
MSKASRTRSPVSVTASSISISTPEPSAPSNSDGTSRRRQCRSSCSWRASWTERVRKRTRSVNPLARIRNTARIGATRFGVMTFSTSTRSLNMRSISRLRYFSSLLIRSILIACPTALADRPLWGWPPRSGFSRFGPKKISISRYVCRNKLAMLTAYSEGAMFFGSLSFGLRGMVPFNFNPSLPGTQSMHMPPRTFAYSIMSARLTALYLACSTGSLPWYTSTPLCCPACFAWSVRVSPSQATPTCVECIRAQTCERKRRKRGSSRSGKPGAFSSSRLFPGTLQMCSCPAPPDDTPTPICRVLSVASRTCERCPRARLAKERPMKRPGGRYVLTLSTGINADTDSSTISLIFSAAALASSCLRSPQSSTISHSSPSSPPSAGASPPFASPSPSVPAEGGLAPFLSSAVLAVVVFSWRKASISGETVTRRSRLERAAACL